ncbi:hypothetical protein [Methylobacterium radiotolerans]
MSPTDPPQSLSDENDSREADATRCASVLRAPVVTGVSVEAIFEAASEMRLVGEAAVVSQHADRGCERGRVEARLAEVSRDMGLGTLDCGVAVHGARHLSGHETRHDEADADRRPSTPIDARLRPARGIG